MEKERSHMTERILNLTLEIIYLLTGEEFTVVGKKSGNYMTPKSHLWGPNKTPTIEPSFPSLISENINNKKILNVTQKITELLTGEVPIRCQDVSVYFSMEEWEYLEGHKDLYEDVMMEDHQTLTSPDRSSNGDPQERCPRPLNSRDSIPDHQGIPWNYQVGNVIKVEVKEEELLVRIDGLVKEENIFPEISTGDRYETFRKGDSDVEDNEITSDPAEENLVTQNLHSSCPNVNQSSDPSAYRGWSLDHPYSINHPIHCTREKLQCPKCEKCFTNKSSLSKHRQVKHPEKRIKKQYVCFKCGKSCESKSRLLRHESVHTHVRPFVCTKCSRTFNTSFRLHVHQRTHTGEKPFSCCTCDKRFIQKASLVQHQKTHLKPKINTCLECGKHFRHWSQLLEHLKFHVRVKPKLCQVCGKRAAYLFHQEEHKDRELHLCSECSKCYVYKVDPARHGVLQRVSDQLPVMCSSRNLPSTST
ncbi:gastrula zinc finger protein XlCGF66.1-like isoform X2 [Pyxicephalus adspersus]|uniref:gastrula zinc finger protein XlCGF66.1-like isoform X2 n=1 Tax=Pyxicephalus adspersus TaxID=30357 RepID=UPI003B5B7B26